MADKAAIRRPGKDVSLITYGGSLFKTLEAAETLARDGVEAEVLDLRVLRPLDEAAILASVTRTRRAVIVDEGWRSGSLAAEIGMRIAEKAFYELDAPLARVCSEEVPIPYPRHLEEAALPQPPAAGVEPVLEAKGLSQGQIVRKRFLGHSGAIIGLVVFAFIFILAFTSVGYLGIPGWWKYNHEQVSPLVNDGAPTSSLWPLAWGEHPFGQDRIGRDLFAMTMRGAQQSITVMVVIGVIAGLLGVLVGAISGYFRGWAEAILMRLTDVIIIERDSVARRR